MFSIITFAAENTTATNVKNQPDTPFPCLGYARTVAKVTDENAGN